MKNQLNVSTRVSLEIFTLHVKFGEIKPKEFIIVWSDVACSKNFTLYNTFCMSTEHNNVSIHARRNCPRSSYWLRSQSLLGPGPLARPKGPGEFYSILWFQEKDFDILGGIIHVYHVSKYLTSYSTEEVSGMSGQFS